MPPIDSKQDLLIKLFWLTAISLILMGGLHMAFFNKGDSNIISYTDWDKLFYSPIQAYVSNGQWNASSSTVNIRSAHLHPFSADSVWNTALGTGASFEEYSGRRNIDFRTGPSYINSANGYGIEMNVAQPSDPLRRVSHSEGKGLYVHRIPENAMIAEGTDANLNVIDGRYVYEYWVVKRMGDGNYSARFGERTDLLGSGIGGGIRAARFSTNAGLIRQHEVENLHIPHVLAMALPGSALKKGWVWPAAAEDGENDDYTGSIAMGSLFAIPPEIDLNKMGLSPEGMMLGRALQDYGAYVSDRADQVALFASSDVERQMPDQFRRMLADFNDVLRAEMRLVTNNMQFNVGGGGLRRQPPASALIGWP